MDSTGLFSSVSEDARFWLTIKLQNTYCEDGRGVRQVRNRVHDP